MQYIAEIAAPCTPGVVVAGCLFGLIFITGIVLDLVLLARFRRHPPESGQLVSVLQNRPWIRHDVATIVVLFLAVQGVLIFLWNSTDLFDVIPQSRLPVIALLLQTLILPGVGLAVVVTLMRERRLSPARAFGISSKDVPANVAMGIMFYLATVPLYVFCSAVYLNVLDMVGYRVEPQEVLELLIDAGQPGWLRSHLVLLALFAAPLVEEVLFRGIALPVLLRRFRPASAIFLASLLFALLHFHIPSIVPLFVIATAFSLGYIHSGSLLVPIVMHALFNTVSLIATLLLKGSPLFSLLPD